MELGETAGNLTVLVKDCDTGVDPRELGFQASGFVFRLGPGGQEMVDGIVFEVVRELGVSVGREVFFGR